MKNSVVIKGMKSGIVIMLDKNLEYEKLKGDITQKFKSSSKFLGNADVCVNFEGRKLSDEQVDDVLGVIKENTDLNVVCVLSKDENEDKIYQEKIEENIKKSTDKRNLDIIKKAKQNLQKEKKLEEERKRFRQEKEQYEKEKKLEKQIEQAKLLASSKQALSDEDKACNEEDFINKFNPCTIGRLHIGGLRSGQAIEMDTSVVVIGDVNHGANIVAKGNVIVLGTLYGNVYAGSDGAEDAFVIALKMQATQIRIGNVIARSSDSQEEVREKDAKVAYVEDGRIYIEKINRSVIKDLKM